MSRFIRTADGYLTDPFDIKPQDIKFDVFAHSLSQINRFTGHAKHPFSVSQHTLNLHTVVPRKLRKAAIIHDCPEVWFNDMASPVKRELPEYRAAEHCALAILAGQVGVEHTELEELDWYDKQMYINERDALFPVRHGVGNNDNLHGLPHCRPGMFDETPWRLNRQRLYNLLIIYFGDGDEVPFWVRNGE